MTECDLDKLTVFCTSKEMMASDWAALDIELWVWAEILLLIINIFYFDLIFFAQNHTEIIWLNISQCNSLIE